MLPWTGKSGRTRKKMHCLQQTHVARTVLYRLSCPLQNLAIGLKFVVQSQVTSHDPGG